ncbi:lysozyme inhibitor LprI family protein [Terribacillus sp. 179-K 1B1 HS]|uniref:lysozyme inhibitor LprI family protein n=1 Tax=Terribacillus sp. 179-K 1B1 HS TaxID=3142388 RepID=UPI00399FC63C
MKNKKMILTAMSAIAFFALAACDSSDEKTTKSADTETNNVSVKEKTNALTETGSDNNESNKNEDENKSSTSAEDNISISSGDQAVKFLKEQLEEGKDEDISFGTDGKLLNNQKGSYYVVQLVDVSIRASGKTGNLGYYSVYQDGTYEEFQASAATENENTLGKNDYLKELNAMEEADRNAEAKYTTKDMVDQEDERYKKWDAKLNEIYGVLNEQLSTDEMNELKEKQRTWIVERDNEAKEASLKYEGGSMETLELVATKATLTRERCYELIASYMK